MIYQNPFIFILSIYHIISYFEKYRKYKNLYFELKAGDQDYWKQTVTRDKGVEKARKKFKDIGSRKKWKIRIRELDGQETTIRILPGGKCGTFKGFNRG